MTDRLAVYQLAIKEAGLNEFVLKIKIGLQPQKVVQMVNNFLTKHAEIDAILFATNYLALEGFEALNEKNLKISEHV